MTINAQLVPKELPKNLSGIETNPNHLLSTVSVGALSRASGWMEGAVQIDKTLASFEETMEMAA